MKRKNQPRGLSSRRLTVRACVCVCVCVGVLTCIYEHIFVCDSLAWLQRQSHAVTNDHPPTGLELDRVAAQINTRHRAAKRAQDESLELFLGLYLAAREAEPEKRVVDAVVVELRDNGFIAFVPRCVCVCVCV